MDNADLRPALPWRRVVPGTYAAETPTGEVYMVERTEDGWRVVLRGPRGGREVLGEPSRIKWVGQCRAENHYLHARKARGAKGAELSSEKLAAAAADAKQRKPKAAESTGRASAAAASSKPAAAPPPKPTRKGVKEPRASHRHRRAAPAAKPPKPAAPLDPLPAHTLAWKVSQQNGREFHVAEHEGGTFKILEVKGTEGFALFSEPAEGVVQEIQCGSLDDCKQTAASMHDRKGRKRRAADADKPGKPAKKAAATETKDEVKPRAKAKDKPTEAKETAAEPASAKTKDKPAEAKAAAAAPAPAKAGACGCDPPEPTQTKSDRAPLDQAKQAKIVDGLKAALRKVNPATLRES